MKLRADTVLGDLLRAALDDTGARLAPTIERRVIDRMAELADVAGIELHRDPTPHGRDLLDDDDGVGD